MMNSNDRVYSTLLVVIMLAHDHAEDSNAGMVAAADKTGHAEIQTPLKAEQVAAWLDKKDKAVESLDVSTWSEMLCSRCSACWTHITAGPS